MNQVRATFVKVFKEFTMKRPVLVWRIALPIVLLIFASLVSLRSVSGTGQPLARGEVTILMGTFALMLAGTYNLSGSIATDRETGLLRKLKSMPVNPLWDFSGRIMAVAVFSVITLILVVIIGTAFGARFDGNATGNLLATGFLFVVIAASAGIGLIIGSLVKSVQGAVMTGMGLSIVTAYLSGIFVSYSLLPPFLQEFSRIYPISSAGALVTYLVLGESVTGYNPLTISQVSSTVALSMALVGIGAVLYSRASWRKQ